MPQKHGAVLRALRLLLMQIENEYGFCPLAPDAQYLDFLEDRIHRYLGKDTIIYTTDPPSVINKGTIRGKDVYS